MLMALKIVFKTDNVFIFQNVYMQAWTLRSRKYFRFYDGGPTTPIDASGNSQRYPYYVVINQYHIGRRGCALMLSLLKANWDRRTGRQADGRASTSKYRDACASTNLALDS